MHQQHNRRECTTCIRSKGVLDLPVGTSNLAILKTHYGYILRAHVPRGTQRPHRRGRN